MDKNNDQQQNKNQAQNQQTNYTIKVPEEMEAGIYANAFAVNFTPNECIIDVAYRVPQSKNPTIKVVSRINMSHSSAESFLKVLSNGLLDWKNRNEQKKNQQ